MALSFRAALCSLVMCAMVPAAGGAQTVSQKTPPPARGSMKLDVTPVPLLSIASLNFLEGTWAAAAADGGAMGNYVFARELEGHILARHGTVDPECEAVAKGASVGGGSAVGGGAAGNAVCAHRDLFYVFQDSPGAPLRAIYFDTEGHVIRYDVEIRHEGGSYDQRDFAIFNSDPSELGPRYRLSYERNTDTFTNKTSLKGKFEVLMANGVWHPYVQWGGRKVQ